MTEPTQDEPGANLPQHYGQPTALARFQHRPPQIQPLDDDSVSLTDYLRILVRRKWLLAAVALTALVVAFLQVFTTTPLYRAEVSLQIDPEDAKVLPYEEITQVGGSLGKEDYLMTQAEKLKSRSLARRVVRVLQLAERSEFTEPTRKGILLDLVSGLTRGIRTLLSGSQASTLDEGVLATRLSSHLSVRPLRRTRLIEVSYESPDPALAAQIANSLAEEFIAQHLESKYDSTTRATEFLDKQLEELKVRVEQSEESLIRYAQAKNIVNINERETINRKKLADLSDELTQAESQLITQSTRYEAAARANLNAFPEALKSAQIRELEVVLGERERRLAGLSGRYGPGWPAVKDLNLEIGELSRQLESEKRQAIAAANAEYRLARDRRDRLAAALREQRQSVDR
ncbi:MAG: Wzz/FepE/Etk N-terminal domain-containing protein, partial [Acidobacteriota bacterium]